MVATRRLVLERRTSLQEAVERGGVWFDWPAGLAEPAPPVFWGEDIEPKLLAPHRERGPYPEVGIACLHGAVLLDEAILADAAGRPYLSDELFPSHVNVWIERGDRPKRKRPLCELEAVDLPGVSVLVHNWAAGIYGHWLVEGLTKLLYLRTVPIAPARFIVQASAQPHVAKWIRHVVPGAEIASYDPDTQYVLCEALVTPTLASSQRYVFHPALVPLLEKLAPRRPAERLLYLQRPWRGVTHWMENPDEVEELAQSLGFEIFSPYRRSPEEHIEVFGRARVIAGDYSSAVHNSLFSPPQTRVLCFNWVTFIQSRIAQLCRQRIGFQMGDTGVPLTNEGYTVDLDAAKRAFEAALRAGE